MTRISLARAGRELPELVRKAEAGESVVITRNGQPVAEVRALPPTLPATGRAAIGTPPGEGPAPDDHLGLAWLANLRKRLPPQGMDAATLVRMMRDEEI